MPLTKTGKGILRNMIKSYGSKEKGEQVFYASINAKVPGSSEWHEVKKKRGKKQ